MPDYARSRIRLTIDFGEHGIFPYQAGDSFISRRYTCDSKYGTPVWLIQRPSSETILEWNVETVLTGFISDGLEALKTEFSQSGSEKSSKLRIHSRASTNYTVFSCIQFRNGLYGNQTEWFIYGFYGTYGCSNYSQKSSDSIIIRASHCTDQLHFHVCGIHQACVVLEVILHSLFHSHYLSCDNRQ